MIRNIELTRGLDLPIAGEPSPEIGEAAPPRMVALLGPDYVDMRPTMAVQVGDRVKTGQLLFTDKKNPGVRYTSPGRGVVEAVQRGAKRAFQAVVVRLEGDEAETFTRYESDRLGGLQRDAVVANLVDSGLWTALRTRPFGKVPAPETEPAAIFVTAIDTQPLAANPVQIIAERPEAFADGLRVLTRLTTGTVYLCKAPGAEVPGGEVEGVKMVAFSGPHPAGLPGTHIHFLAPVGRARTVWYINYQDVMAMGHLFTTGELDTRRVIALAGPSAKNPRLVRTRLGANLDELVEGETKPAACRVISGSVLSGREAAGPLAFLGRYHLQVSLLPDRRRRELFGWVMPGFHKFSLKNIFASKLLPEVTYSFSTSLHGSPRAIVPIGSYERVMPLDILPTFLLRALAVNDLEQAESLGCLELEEEDLALCTFVCPGKADYGAMLRRNLTTMEKEG